MNKNLMTIVVESLAFFELAGDDDIDPDAAVAQMEGAAATLEQMSEDEKKEFIAFVREYADDEEKAKGPRERIEFFRTLPEHFGLTE